MGGLSSHCLLCHIFRLAKVLLDDFSLLQSVLHFFGPSKLQNVTQILERIRSGDPVAADELLPLVYDQLRTLAMAKLAHEKPGQTLVATALVHEAYVRLVDVENAQQWDSRGHFFAAAAEAMRRILVENARRKQTVKHGGGRNRVNLDSVAAVEAKPTEDLIAIDEALNKLAAKNAAKAEVVKLRYFAGLTMPEIAKALKISLATAERHWTYARTWLYAEMKDQDSRRENPG